MLSWLSADPNLPFSISLALMLAVAVLEGIGLLLGLGFSQLLEQLIDPLVAEPGVELDADGASLSEQGFFAQLLGWLHIGKVPLLILLIVFLTAFGLIGFILQALVKNLSGYYLPATIASLVTFVPTLLTLRWSGAGIARVLPNDESEAVSSASFIGRIATITLGEAHYNSPSQAKLHDQFGQTHYLMVAPDQPDESFVNGSKVLLVRQEGSVFRAIHNPHTSLID